MRYLLATLIFLFAASAQANADMAVVVNKQSPVEKLSKREVAKIFLSKTNRLPNGNRVKTIELSDSDYKEIFYRAISGKTLPQINSYWTTLIFTGKGRPPKNYKDLRQLIEALNRDIGTICYMPADEVTNSMRIVYVVRTAH